MIEGLCRQCSRNHWEQGGITHLLKHEAENRAGAQEGIAWGRQQPESSLSMIHLSIHGLDAPGGLVHADGDAAGVAGVDDGDA